MCGTFRNFTHESNLWISNGGTRSVVHYDADHNLHCLLSGRKDFIMISNNITTQTNLYFKRKVNTYAASKCLKTKFFWALFSCDWAKFGDLHCHEGLLL